jgi:hypothetical protein
MRTDPIRPRKSMQKIMEQHFMSKHLMTLLGLLTLAALTACAPMNKIPLQYFPAGGTIGNCRASVAVAPFEDRRGMERIGEHGPDMVLFPGSSVSQWVTWALVDELKAAGCQTFHAESTATAPSDNLVTGTIQQVYIRKLGSPFEYLTEIRLGVVLKRAGETVWMKEYSGSVKKTSTPTTETYRDTLQEGLRDILVQVIADLNATL